MAASKPTTSISQLHFLFDPQIPIILQPIFVILFVIKMTEYEKKYTNYVVTF